MVKMTATKAMKYADRRLQPGEDFDTKSDRDMKVLLAKRVAKVKRPEGELPPPPPAVEKRIVAVMTTNENPVPPQTAPTNETPVEPKVETAGDDLVQARAAYEDASGKRAYHGWDLATLREKTAALGS